MWETRDQLPKANMLEMRISLGTQIQDRMAITAITQLYTSLIQLWWQEKKWSPTAKLCHCGAMPTPGIKDLMRLHELVAFIFPHCSCRPSSVHRASATSSPHSTPSNNLGCSSHRLKRATTSSRCGFVARGHACPKRNSARSWFLPTSHRCEPWSLPHLMNQQSRWFFPKLVTQHKGFVIAWEANNLKGLPGM